ncbi:hypothetical protein Q9R19_09850 [Microbacterium sp. ARD32]|uniref:hypothetical protein n=1 Tax=Microbacterium sp. ARD32 TaxID=2962577 RepID=UPI0028823315|nr:hypothetical protein [Microbacterium sp. ARD32]MDT0157926.1 hypothetical protein [Microbacterium sp. ARD32]
MSPSIFSALSATAPDPTPGEFIGLLLWILCTAVAICVVAIHVCVAAVLPPPRPLAETSVLGRHIVGLSRIVVVFLGFLGGLLLTTMITLGGDYWSASGGMDNLMGQLWSVLSILAAGAAFVFWFWAAVDLIRLGPSRRLAAVDWWYKRRLNRIGVRWVERSIRALGQGVVGGPWWAILLTFYLAPPVAILGIAELLRIVPPILHA